MNFYDAIGQAKAKKENEFKAPKADKPKAGADVRKIVNLMAGDTDRVRIFVSSNRSLINRLGRFRKLL